MNKQVVLIGGYSEEQAVLRPVARILGAPQARIIGWHEYRSLVSGGDNLLPKLEEPSVVLSHSSGVVLAKQFLDSQPEMVESLILVSPVGHENLPVRKSLWRFSKKNFLLFALLASPKMNRGGFARAQLTRLLWGGTKEICLHPIALLRCFALLANPNFIVGNLGKKVKVVHVHNDALSPRRNLPGETSVIEDSGYGHDSFMLDQSFIKKLTQLI